MELIAFEKAKELISRVYKTDDLNEIASYIKDLQHEIKRDEIFVSEISNLLNEESISHYKEALNYLDGAIYIINSYKISEGTNLNSFIDLIKRGWTRLDYDDFFAFRSQEYRDPIICETTDLYTELHNEANDEGYKDVSSYINETYESIENFCIVTVQSYYCENLEEKIKALMAV